MSYLRQLWTVSMWEYRRFFKIKNELIGIAIMLVISLGMYWGGSFLKSMKEDRVELTVIESIDEKLLSVLRTEFEIAQISFADKEDFISKIKEDRQGIFFDVDEDAYQIVSWKEPAKLSRLKNILNDYQRTNKMINLGISNEDLANIYTPVNLETTYLEGSIAKGKLVYFFAFLTIMALFLSFSYQFVAITGEKQLKITEQIVSAIKPQTWMDGKILGITMTALSSMALYSIMSILGGIIYFQILKIPLSTILDILHLPSIIIFFIFTIMGILLWNALLAAIASVITDPNNSSKSSLMFVPMLFVTATLMIPPHHRAGSFIAWFPLTSSTAMPMRWVVDVVAWWELIGSFALLILTFIGLRILAAKIFRISILISGKEPSWKEIFKMIREIER
ncbi:ABC transporter permease [bacterium]|nr:ABC transporter permease [bacterium]